MSVEITNEPEPAPRASGKAKISGGIRVRLIDPKTGEQVGCSESLEFSENERQLREALAYGVETGEKKE